MGNLVPVSSSFRRLMGFSPIDSVFSLCSHMRRRNPDRRSGRRRVSGGDFGSALCATLSAKVYQEEVKRLTEAIAPT
jgi:hypothetical protein